MRRLLGAFREQDAVIGEDRDRHAIEARKAADERFAIELLELMEFRPVNEARDHFAGVIGFADILRHEAMHFGRIIERLGRFGKVERLGLRLCQRTNNGAHNGKRMGIMGRVMVGHAGLAGMNVCAAEVFGGDHLPCRGLHQRRTAEEDGPLLAHDDGLVRHGRHIGAACGTAAHDRGDLGNAFRAHLGLVVEDPAEMLAVREDFGLVRQVRAAAIDQIDAGQMILERHFLRAKVLLHRHREVGAALHRGIIADDQAFAAFDPAHARDETRAGGFIVVHAIGRQRADLKEGRARIQQAFDSLPRQQFAPLDMAFPGRFRPAKCRFGGFFAQFGKKRAHGRFVGGKFATGHIKAGFQNRHNASHWNFVPA